MVTSASLQTELAAMPPVDTNSAAAARDRASSVLRPPGALAQLDDLAIWIAGWQRTGTPTIESPAGLVFAGDHGVAVEGVSAYPTDITAAMLAAVQSGQASINALAAAARASVRAIDVGVGEPTGNLRIEPAMSPERFVAAFETGRQAVRATETDLLVIGELGIANTTAAAAVTAAIIGGETATFVGRGTGIADDALELKTRVVGEALERIAAVSDPLEKLRQVGGTELAAMAGAMVQARADSIPLLLDGYIATSSALTLHAIDPGLIANARAGHRSAEPGHGAALARLGLEPLLSMEFRLGEGSGAMAAVPLVVAACEVVTNVATFDEFFGEADGAAAT